MNLQELKDSLQQRDEITFILPSGEYVPPHFHVTEVGKSSKLYVDCGGTVRAEEFITFTDRNLLIGICFWAALAAGVRVDKQCACHKGYSF